LESVSNVREVLLDEEIDEQKYINIINNIYNQDCYIYANIPEWENDLFNELSNDFILIKKIQFPLIRIFPRIIVFLGYVKDSTKQYIWEYYLRSTTMDFLVFSEIDVSQRLNNVNKKILIFIKYLNKIKSLT